MPILYLFVVRLRKMDIEEHPLVLSLLWGEQREDKSFSLQENERGEILVS